MAVTMASSMEAQHTRLATQDFYRDSTRVVSTAAALALDQHKVESAIEFLEQGRNILFSQMRRFRTPLLDLQVVDEELADEFG